MATRTTRNGPPRIQGPLLLEELQLEPSNAYDKDPNFIPKVDESDIEDNNSADGRTYEAHYHQSLPPVHKQDQTLVSIENQKALPAQAAARGQKDVEDLEGICVFQCTFNKANARAYTITIGNQRLQLAKCKVPRVIQELSVFGQPFTATYGYVTKKTGNGRLHWLCKKPDGPAPAIWQRITLENLPQIVKVGEQWSKMSPRKRQDLYKNDLRNFLRTHEAL